MKIVADRLKELRIENRLTQEKVANIINVSRTTYLKYEKDLLEIPIELLCKLADYYHVSMDYLTGRSDF